MEDINTGKEDINTGKEEYDQDLENRILRIVAKTRKSRNRPCCDNIHAMLNRGGREIGKDEVKIFVQELLGRGILLNSGSDETESFRITNIISDSQENSTQNDDNFLCSPSPSNANTVVDAGINNITDDISSMHNEHTTSSAYPVNDALANDAIKVNDDILLKGDFFETLITRIKKEVNMCVDLKLKQINGMTDFAEINNNKQSELNILRNELESLRNELKSKDEIINTLKRDKTTLENKSRNKDCYDDIFVTDVFTKQHTKSTPYTKDGTKTSRSIRYGDKGDIKVTFDRNKQIQTRQDVNVSDDESYINDDTESSFTEFKGKSNRKKNIRSITIIGDSTLKDCKVHKIKHKLARNEKLYIKAFNGANIEDMVDYARPTMRRDPDLIVLHAGTNDLRSQSSAKNIADDIMRLGLQMKSDQNDVMISSILYRADSLNDKGMQVNQILKAECARYNMVFIENSNISRNHLNGSGLHLNFKGTVTLANNFLRFIKI